MIDGSGSIADVADFTLHGNFVAKEDSQLVVRLLARLLSAVSRLYLLLLRLTSVIDSLVLTRLGDESIPPHS